MLISIENWRTDHPFQALQDEIQKFSYFFNEKCMKISSENLEIHHLALLE